ncbi:MAG: TIGR00266 family protein, partial [Cyanothece sp. SIO1E1]|nr:TIGR00266 family protein [Cyanothece sp. SIO1E1]
MEIELLNQPDSSIARVVLSAREELVAEAGCMVAMSGDIQASTTLRKGRGGGLLGGIKRAIAGESLFLSVFRAPVAGREVYIAPKLPGDLLLYGLEPGTGLVVQATSYLASGSGVDIDLGFQGFKSVFSGESIFWLDISGAGPVLLSAFGGIYDVMVQGENRVKSLLVSLGREPVN